MNSDATAMSTLLPDAGAGQPILLLAAPGSGGERLMPALLAAPGTWNVTELFAPWVAQVEAGEQPDHDALRERLRESHQTVDWSRMPGDAQLRLILRIVPSGRLVVALEEFFGTFQVLLLHRSPTAAVRGAVDRSAALRVWNDATESALASLDRATSWTSVAVEGLQAEPRHELQRCLTFLGIGWHGRVTGEWIQRSITLRASGEGAASLDELVPDAETVARAEMLDRRVRDLIPRVEPSLKPTTAAGSLTAIDDGMAALLRTAGSSLLVSTYQTNRLISLRAAEGGLGVHLRAFDKPMGMARLPDGLVLGTRSEIIEFVDLPEAAHGLEPQGTYDACYLPRSAHVTGDIAVHDLGVGRDGLWVVATKFNCLATLDAHHSFVPQWRPPFISALVAEDRCHLNGMALVDGVPRWVTLLGASDEEGGWRAHKATGGLLMEVPSGRVVVSGLSMPHSPRWHDGRLWVLESGRGRLLEVFPETGKTRVVVELPGFTRGLAFHGGHAFVGTSQVRETATFGGLPIADRGDLECGVSAIELSTGRVVASVRFEDRIEELFEVAVLPGVRCPEIAEWGSDLVQKSWSVPRARGVGGKRG